MPLPKGYLPTDDIENDMPTEGADPFLEEEEEFPEMGLEEEWLGMDDASKAEAAQAAGMPPENLERLITEAAKVPEYQAMPVAEFVEAISANPDLIIQLQRTAEAPPPQTRSEQAEAGDEEVPSGFGL
tara:strand:- start:12311 stop:12694 length:384 start_codon:yes stop_codon:yes gene_type:complete